MLNQNEINRQLWRICENFKNKTEIKKNYIVYISALLFIEYDDSVKEQDIYDSNLDSNYIRELIDRMIENIRQNKNDRDLFSNIRFQTIKEYQDRREEEIIRKTGKEIHQLIQQALNRKSIAKAYDYILEQAIYRDDIIQEAGKFHTPEEITRMMASLIITKDCTNVYDPICGSGNFLKSAVEFQKVDIYGKENNLDYYNIIKTRLLLNEINSDNIIYGNPCRDEDIKSDIILCNPPFADKTWKENALFNNTEFKYLVPESAVGDYAYVLNMLEKLREYGKMAVVLPHGVLFRENERNIREKLINDNYIEAIIGLPESLFHGTRISVIIMVISKNRKEEDVLFIDASQNYESKRKNNILSKKYQEKIVETYHQKREIENYSYLASKEEIRNNKFDLTIKKYVQKRKEKTEIVSREKLSQIVGNLKLKQGKIEEDIKDVLEILGYKDIEKPQETPKREVNYLVIGEKIKQARKQKGMTMEELSGRLQISAAYLSRIERGASMPSLNILVQICDILNLSIEELLKSKNKKCKYI